MILFFADLLLAFSAELFFVGVAVWGLHLGLTQGVLSSLVADYAPVQWRGTAFGVFNLVSSIVLLLASALAGWIWDQWGARVSFLTGAGLVLLALAVGASLFFVERKSKIDS